MMKTAGIALAVTLLASGAVAQTLPALPASNSEMLRLFAEDQGDRKTANIDWSVVNPRDTLRRAATRKLLAEGSLHTGEDYNAAAFVFQHGETPDDYLLAHTLAMVAMAKGRKDSLWIAAATLDRYLRDIGRPQIFGTQYFKETGKSWTQEPFDRGLISDPLREEFRVPPLAVQAEELKRMDVVGSR